MNKRILLLSGLLSLLTSMQVYANSVYIPLPAYTRADINGNVVRTYDKTIKIKNIEPKNVETKPIIQPQKQEIKVREVSKPIDIEQSNNNNQGTAISAISTPIKKPETIIKPQMKSNINLGNVDMQRIADEIKTELVDEDGFIIEDLRVLWQSSVQRSETIKFAIYKLSNPKGEEEKKNIAKKILTPLASAAPFVGAGVSDTVISGSSIIGGGMLSSILADDSIVNQKLSKVSDADLVMLAQEIDTLQQTLVSLYYEYLSATKELYMVNKIVQNREKYCCAVQKSKNDVVAVADVFYRDAIDQQYKARQNLLNKRASLEQFVGNEALLKIDEKMNERFAQ